MKEYIEREAAIKAIENDCSELVYYTKEDAIQCVKAIPAADVVEVVRCKDCLYSTERYGHMDCIHGVSYRNTWNKPDFFCSYGERKEGAD